MRKFTTVMVLLLVLMITASAWAQCTGNINEWFKSGAMAGFFRPGDTYKMALVTGSNTQNGNAVHTYADLTNEVANANCYATGGQVIGTITYSTASNKGLLDFTTPEVWTPTCSFTTSCAMIYTTTDRHADCTASTVPYPCCTGAGTGCTAGMAVGMWSFTSATPDGTDFTVNFPSAGASTSLIQSN